MCNKISANGAGIAEGEDFLYHSSIEIPQFKYKQKVQ